MLNIDPVSKYQSIKPISIKETVDELKISKDNYYSVFAIPKDEDLKLYLKSQSNSCFVTNCFDIA